MTRPRSGGGRPAVYKTKDGETVPGVTTILGRYKEAGPLIHWAWKLGIEGKDYRQVRDEAGGIGHVAHDRIEHLILLPGAPLPALPLDLTEEQVRAVEAAMQAFDDWRQQNRLVVLATEVPLVSERYRYGGTLDAIAQLMGLAKVLLDWKTSNRIYIDYLLQLAAYRELWRENTGEDLESAHLLRIGKEFGDFHHSGWPSRVLDSAWENFLALRQCFDREKLLKKAVGA